MAISRCSMIYYVKWRNSIVYEKVYNERSLHKNYKSLPSKENQKEVA